MLFNVWRPSFRQNSANSHKDLGWQKFSDSVIKKINDERRNVVFLLWGQFAQKKAAFVDLSKHAVVKVCPTCSGDYFLHFRLLTPLPSVTDISKDADASKRSTLLCVRWDRILLTGPTFDAVCDIRGFRLYLRRYSMLVLSFGFYILWIKFEVRWLTTKFVRREDGLEFCKVQTSFFRHSLVEWNTLAEHYSVVGVSSGHIRSL